MSTLRDSSSTKAGASSESSLASNQLPKGTYAPAGSSAVRSPCPMINALANHGYLPRDGRNVLAGDLLSAMDRVGLSSALAASFVRPLYLERKQSQPATSIHSMSISTVLRSLLVFVISLISNPWTLFSSLALRKPGQEDVKGVECLNLDQLAIPGILEHDISLTRLDYAQGDNHTPQPELVSNLLASSSDGGKSLSLEDLAKVRRHRIQVQRKDDPQATYGPKQHIFASTEIGLVLGVLGDGHNVRHDFVSALFLEERLPIEEGWKARQWWRLGLIGIFWLTGKAAVKSL